ncbi:WAT1-related protein At1g25270-like [Vigna unguiculata]|uniref:WAT1-related protein n=1 Tax=Vigna unguiculata TaxID=3917 RepID=A0A4D6NGY8_VIGUN|nr:WAT1-related protein At1g25270-like [Vigna unguiculata]QCE12946.1 WAT1-related protein [Vigna unguiculata]
MNGWWKVMEEWKPSFVMVLVQFAYAATSVLAKLAAHDGMSMRVLTAYRLIFGAAFSLSLALIFERKNRPKLTWRVLWMSFFCGLFGGSLFQNLFMVSLTLVSATYAYAVFNMVPAVTFILSFFCGYEELNVRSTGGQSKVLGTILGITGTMLLSFFKGTKINVWNLDVNLLHANHTTSRAHSKAEWVGILSGMGSCLSFSIWLIIQVKVSKQYPRHHSGSALMNLMGALQATALALCVDKDRSQWKLGLDIRLLTALFTGIVSSGFAIIATAWCVRKRGPLYASVFNPLCLVLVAIAASLLLQEQLYLGSVIGGVLIVCGLYMVLWGKSKDMKTVTPFVSSENTEEFVVSEVVVVSKTENSESNVVITKARDESLEGR